ncbi:MAG: DUF4392 domain-containing protein [Candidatus Bathyarchaeota archaeon]|jgi:hypothetical protein
MSELNEQLLIGFGDIVDRIVSTPMGTAPIIRKGRGGAAKLRYTWMRVYDETRLLFGKPLTLMAAEELIEKVRRGDRVLIVTNSHEMDGPPGSAALARSLVVGLGAIPIIVVEYKEDTKFEKAVPQACIGAQLIPVTDPQALRGSIWTPYTVLIHRWPEMTVQEAEETAERLMERYDPRAVVTVEAVSCNKKGINHGALGGPRNTGDPQEPFVRFNQILIAAKKRGVLTIATGDNGNECGFASIEGILKKYHEFCRDCGCPCGEGIVSASKADIVIPANSSNWACYGIGACLAKLLNKPEVLHDEYTHDRILLNCANVGIPDGATAMCTPTTDGASHEACIYVLGMLRQTVLMSDIELIRESR